MNSQYFAFYTKSYFGGPVNADMNFGVIRGNFYEYWLNQIMWSKITFKLKPLGDNPFKDYLFTSPGKYDIANINMTLGPCKIFVSDRMLDIFSKVKVPKYELFPIKYRQRGNIYNGYFLTFLEDYTQYVDFQNSKICYRPYGFEHFQPVKFQSGDDFSAFIRENASIKHENGATNLGDFKYPEIRFLDFVYEMDLFVIPYLTNTPLISNKLKSILENEKIKNLQFFDVMGTHYKFKDYTLNLDEDKFC